MLFRSMGVPVSHVVAARNGFAARVVAPDPRYFALQKLWLAEKPARSALKRPKDRTQGLRILNAVRDYMPHYPLSADFRKSLSAPLKPHFEAWLRDEGDTPRTHSPKRW